MHAEQVKPCWRCRPCHTASVRLDTPDQEALAFTPLSTLATNQNRAACLRPAAANKKVRRELAASDEAAAAIAADTGALEGLLAQAQACCSGSSGSCSADAGAQLFRRVLQLVASLRQRLHDRVRPARPGATSSASSSRDVVHAKGTHLASVHHLCTVLCTASSPQARPRRTVLQAVALRCLQSSDLVLQPVSTEELELQAGLAAAAQRKRQAEEQAAAAEVAAAAAAATKAGSKTPKAGTGAKKAGKGAAAAEAAAVLGDAGVPAPGLAEDVRRALAQSRQDIAQLAKGYYASKSPTRAIRCAAASCFPRRDT